MSRDSFPALARRALLPLAIGAFVMASAIDATASPTNVHFYSFNTTNNTGGASDNARFYVFGQALPNLPAAPVYLAPAFSSTFWPAPSTTVAFLWRWVTWTGGAAVPAGQTRWFAIRVQVVPAGSTYISSAWFTWNAVSGTAGAPVPLGFRISSPPALANPAESHLGGANTHNMVVRDLQYAQSPYAIPVDSLRTDGISVAARFAETADAVRPGPFVVAPGTDQSFVVHPSILDPTPGGRTILVRGTTEDWNGAQVPFVAQFVQPLNMPGSSPIGLLILALILATLGTAYLVRSKRLSGRPSL